MTIDRNAIAAANLGIHYLRILCRHGWREPLRALALYRRYGREVALQRMTMELDEHRAHGALDSTRFRTLRAVDCLVGLKPDGNPLK